MISKQTNWAGNFQYRARTTHYPTTVDEIRQVVRSHKQVGVIGTRHSFNHIADSPEALISLEHLEGTIELDLDRQAVHVPAGLRYGEVCQHLHKKGYALHNLASLPHISVAGACATGTHGSGNDNGNLATAVIQVEFISADGELVKLSRSHSGDTFDGAVVALGGLGVVTRLLLKIEPTYEVQQDLYENLPLSELEKHFEEIFSAAYSVSLFTDWKQPAFNQVWLKRRADEVKGDLPAEWFGAKLAKRPLHPIAGISAENCTEQLGVPGPWHERLPHFRLDFTPSSGQELQSEYILPRAQAIEALKAITDLRNRIAPLLLVSEIRTIAPDRLWLSPCFEQACLAIHFTWKPDWPAVGKLLPTIEGRLAPFQACPHWGKLFTMPAEQLRRLYRKMPDFKQLLLEYDPDGKFRNEFLDAYILGE